MSQIKHIKAIFHFTAICQLQFQFRFSHLIKEYKLKYNRDARGHLPENQNNNEENQINP